MFLKIYQDDFSFGYVQTDTIEFWEQELENFFKTATQLSLKSPLHKVQILPALANEWLSAHLRTNGSVINIYHILLACSDFS